MEPDTEAAGPLAALAAIEPSGTPGAAFGSALIGKPGALLRPSARALFFLTGGPKEASALNGIRPVGGDAVLNGPCADLHARAADRRCWTMAGLRDDHFRAALDRLPKAREGRTARAEGLWRRA